MSTRCFLYVGVVAQGAVSWLFDLQTKFTDTLTTQYIGVYGSLPVIGADVPGGSLFRWRD